MDTQTALQQAETLLQPIAASMTRPDPTRLDAVVAREHLNEAVRALKQAHWGYLSAITGLDQAPKPPAKGAEAVPAGEGQVEMLYHFSHGGAVATLRVSVPYGDAVIPTICDLIPSATLYEREAAEMFGVTFPGTPVTDHLLLPDDWPAGLYPLRKSFSGNPADV